MAKKKNYQNWSKDKLIAENKKLEEKLKKKYGLVWEERQEKVVERCKKELPVLKEVKNKEIITDKNKPVNLLIEGDNYHSLSVLNYTHAKKVNVIYIDPPYNTGNKDFIFNDKYVDPEDGYRHSKWLSFMEKRLKLAKNLLEDTGVIFISIDDNEVAQLKLLMGDPDLFGENNFVANIIWTCKAGGAHDVTTIVKEHEYILCYAKNISKLTLNKQRINISDKKYKYKDKYLKERGKYTLDQLDRSSLGWLKSLDFPIIAPGGKKIYPGGKYGPPFRWRWGKEKVEWGLKNGFIEIKKNSKGQWKVYSKQYQFVDSNGNKIERETPYRTIISDIKTKTSDAEMKSMFGEKVFTYPKPVELIKYLLRISSNKDSVILDFMAGTGTTGQAVLEVNKEDSGNRQFVLCTNDENNICTEVCYPRIKKVIKGYSDSKGRKIKGLGGNLKYFKTDFVGAEPTDKNKKKLTEQATEMLCVKEKTFEPVLNRKKFKIFKNSNHYTGIIFDQLAIPDFKKAIKNIKGKFSIYVFSLGGDTFDEEFSDVKQKVKLSPIPEAILKVYRRIFR